MRIQSYSLEEIQEKHLNLFLPYVLLRLRPQLNPERKFPLTKNELTAFVDKVMIILKDEVEQGYLTEQEYDDYVNLFRRAAENIFEAADRDALALELADKNVELADKNAELARMRALLEQYHIPVNA